MEKKLLSMEELEAQTALALPERETPQTVIVTCVAICVGQIKFRDINVNVAAQICAAVNALNITLINLFSLDLDAAVVECEIKQKAGGGNGGGGNG